MNIIQSVTERIENYRKTNKAPCKNYATEAAANKATAAAAARMGKELCGQGRPAQYLVFYIPSWGRWVGALSINEIAGRPTFQGGFVGGEVGFFSY